MAEVSLVEVLVSRARSGATALALNLVAASIVGIRVTRLVTALGKIQVVQKAAGKAEPVSIVIPRVTYHAIAAGLEVASIGISTAIGGVATAPPTGLNRGIDSSSPAGPRLQLLLFQVRWHT